MTPAEKLLDLFSSEDKWCKLYSFIDKKGSPISTYNIVSGLKIPYSCCLSGAVFYLQLSESYREKIKELINNSLIGAWNDDPSRTFEDIKEVCKKLIEWEKNSYDKPTE